MPHQVVWFDMPVQDLERAIRFYSAVLGAKVHKEQFPDLAIGILPHGEGEISGCLYPSSVHQPAAQGPLLYLNCSGRLDAAIAAVQPNNGKVLQPKHAIGRYGFRAVVLDSEGNRVALHSP